MLATNVLRNSANAYYDSIVVLQCEYYFIPQNVNVWQVMTDQRGGQTYSSIISPTSALGAGGWSTPRPRRLYTPEIDTIPIVDRVGLRAGMNGFRKPRPPPGFDSRTVQPIAGHFTDYVQPFIILYFPDRPFDG
jgi:hypothetical protein